MADRNAEFYFQDIVFRVEDQLFKVPRHMFVQHSQVFRDMFNMPTPTGTGPDGSSDEQPLTLETVEKKDFIQLLQCLYPLQFQRVVGHDFSLDEWKSVLKLANLYEMTEVKDFAVDCMTPLVNIGSPSMQIHLAQAHDVPKWLQPAKDRLVIRSNPITEYDVMLIGLTLALEVCALRESAARENAVRENAVRENEHTFCWDQPIGVIPQPPRPGDNKKKGSWLKSSRVENESKFGNPSGLEPDPQPPCPGGKKQASWLKSSHVVKKGAADLQQDLEESLHF